MVQESVNQDDNKTSVETNEKNRPSTQDENGNLMNMLQRAIVNKNQCKRK